MDGAGWLHCEGLCASLHTWLELLPLSCPIVSSVLTTVFWFPYLKISLKIRSEKHGSFVCLFISCVDSEGGESLSHPTFGFQCFKELKLLTVAFRITSQVSARLPLWGDRKEMGLTLGIYPFPRGLKLHKTPPVRH